MTNSKIEKLNPAFIFSFNSIILIVASTAFTTTQKRQIFALVMLAGYLFGGLHCGKYRLWVDA